jgi:hypothetical protein
MRWTHATIAFLGIVAAALVATHLVHVTKAIRIRDARLHDIKALLAAYVEVRETVPEKSITIEGLTSFLTNKGVRLRNPLAQSHSKPCYRLGPMVSGDRWPILLQETNILDAPTVIIATRDGAVMEVSTNRLRQMERSFGQARPAVGNHTEWKSNVHSGFDYHPQ